MPLCDNLITKPWNIAWMPCISTLPGIKLSTNWRNIGGHKVFLTFLDVTYMLRPFANPVVYLCVLLRFVAQSLKPVKLLDQSQIVIPNFFQIWSTVAAYGELCLAFSESETEKYFEWIIMKVIAFVCKLMPPTDYTTTPNIFGPSMSWVVGSVCKCSFIYLNSLKVTRSLRNSQCPKQPSLN